MERKHRHIVEMGLTLMSQASMPLSYWDHAFHTAVYLINRLPSAYHENTIPYEMIFNKYPDYSFLKVFGCMCFPHLRPFNKHNLISGPVLVLFCGIHLIIKDINVLIQRARFFLSRDVIFNESSFPFSVAKPHDSSPPSSVPSQLLALGVLPIPTAHPNPPSHSIGSIESLGSLSQPVELNSPQLVPTEQAASSTPVNDESSPSTALSSPPPSQPPNTHPMQTRSKSGIVCPRLHPTLLLTTAEPTSVKHALSSPEWKEAMQQEYNALMANNTWSPVPLPSGRKAIGCKWVFRVKQNPDGSILKYKARLVAKGFNQIPGQDYSETFSPVMKPVTIRIMLTVALTHHWSIQQIDVNNAFLNGDLEEEVYMTQPHGFAGSDKSVVCKLKKAIYGLKQTPRAWYERLTKTLLTFGFVQSKCDPSLLVFKTVSDCLYLLIYVDDIIITGSSSVLIQKLITKLHAVFALKQLGNLEFSGY